MEVEGGVVRLIDFMPIRDERPDIVRIVEGVRVRCRWRSIWSSASATAG